MTARTARCLPCNDGYVHAVHDAVELEAAQQFAIPIATPTAAEDESGGDDAAGKWRELAPT